MIKPSTRRLPGLLVVALLAVSLAGCNSQPKRPPPKPRVEPQRTLPQATPQPAAAEQTTPQTTGGAYAAPSSDAAEVEVEEVAVDKAPDPAQAQARTADPTGERATGRQTSGGGTAMPRAGGSAPPPPAAAGVIDLNAPAGDPGDEMVGPAIAIGARTTGEKVEELDDELARKLAAFDERMRRARAAAEAESEPAASAQRAGSAGGALDGAGYRASEPDNARGAGGSASRASGLGNTPDLSGEQDAQVGRVARYGAPAGTPDGRDDDIVARQLREAAEREQDPVLREKLWDEYRKYKAGL